MPLTIEIPASFQRLTISPHVAGDFVIFLADNCEIMRPVIVTDCVTSAIVEDLPNSPKLVLSDSSPEGLPPQPTMRRAASDGAALRHQSLGEPVMDVTFSNLSYVEGGGYVFRAVIPPEYFNGKYSLFGNIIFTDSCESYQFEILLPHGSRRVINHIAFANLRLPSSRNAVQSLFRVLVTFLETILNERDVKQLMLQDKSWITYAALNFMSSLSYYFEDPKSDIGERFLVELAALVEANQFKHHDVALLMVGQLRDMFALKGGLTDDMTTTIGAHGSSACVRVLYSLPLLLLRDGYADNREDLKLAARNAKSDSSDFATAMWLRRGLSFLLDQDCGATVASFRSCRGVIPLLRILKWPGAQSPLLYMARTDWGTLGRLHRFRFLLQEFQTDCAPFLRSSVSLPLEEIRAKLSAHARAEEGEIMANLLSSISDIENRHRGEIERWGAYSDSDAPNLIHIKELIDRCPSALKSAIDAFDEWMSTLETVQSRASKYLATLNRMHMENVVRNPSFRRLWGFKDYLVCKDILLADMDSESKGGADEASSEPIFVEIFGGIGTKGSCLPLLPQICAAQGATFNSPQGLAVLTDGHGNPLFSSGVDNRGEVYVADTLNHAVRVLVKPNEVYTLAGNGSPGGRIGETVKCQFQGPRSVCTVTIADAHGLVNILVVADSTNHCLKGIFLSRSGGSSSSGIFMKRDHIIAANEVFLIVGLAGKGSANGPAATAQLDSPTSVCHFGDSLYVCCRGDHTIRRVSSSASTGWTVQTVAGVSNKAGDIDGTNTLLTSPTSCAAGASGIYFVDQGRTQSIRYLEGSQVSTVLRGGPLKNVTGICVASPNELLICDRGNHCIWSLDTSSGTAVKVVTPFHLPRQGVEEDNVPFNPSAIVKVGEGAFVFSELSRHQVFRLMRGDCLKEAYEVANRVYGMEGVDAKALENAVQNYVCSGMKVFDAVNHALRLNWQVKEAMLNRNYVRELEYMQALVRRKLVPPEGTVAMLRNAPSLYALHQFFRLTPMNQEAIMRYQEASSSFIQLYDFSFPFIDTDRELRALVHLFHDAPSSVATQDLLCRILKDDRFNCSVNEHTLGLLGAYLRTVQWSMDRSNVADLRRETVRWLTRVVCLDASATASPMELMFSALFWWKDFMSINQSLVDNMRASKDDRPFRALAWALRIHLESFCFGFVILPSIVSRDDGEQKASSEEPIKVDKALLALQSACQLCGAVEESPLVLKALGDAIADVSRTLPPAEVCSALFSSLQQRLDDDSARAVDTATSASALSEMIQHTLSDVMVANFSIIEQRIDKRIQQQYEKARKFSTPEELGEIENRRLNPPIWEFYSEIMTFEPQIWSNLLHWKASPAFSLSRERTKWSALLDRLHSKVERTFMGVHTNTLSGHITVDLMRKIQGNKEALMLGWRALNCAMGTTHLIDDLEAEMQNALIEVKTVSKVLTELTPDSLMLMDVQAALNNWPALLLNTYRTMLRLPLPADSNNHSDSFVEFHGVDFASRLRTYAPLPIALLEALDWLLLCTEKVDFFTHFWSSRCGGAITDENIITVSSMWRDLFSSIVDRSITFSSLEENISLLSDVNEITVMVQTCLVNLSSSVENPKKWVYLAKDHPDVTSTVKTVLEVCQQWRKVHSLFTSQDHISKVIDAGMYVMNAAGEADMQQWKGCLGDFNTAVLQRGEWSSQKLQDLQSYWPLAQGLDAGMLKVSLSLLISIKENEPLATFFRIVRDDNAFTSSLEVAMGLQEMECPSELWDSDRGRVDEKYLSMTRNVRSYLYKYLYDYPARLSTVSDFLAVFAHMNSAMSADVIAENLRECNHVREALMEIIRFNAEGASSSRLMKLYEPKCRSSWRLECGNNKSSVPTEGTGKSRSGVELSDEAELRGQHELMLEYFTTSHTTGEERALKHALPELLDFQSNIVLSQDGDLVGGSLHGIVDTFLHQLGWTRRLRDVLALLSDAGHFDYYPSYSFRLSVELEPGEFIARVEDAERKLFQWTEHIADLRERFHFLNYFDIKRCFVLLDALRTFTVSAQDSEATAVLRNVVSRYICFVNASAGYDAEVVAGATSSLIDNWTVAEKASGRDAMSAQLLEPLCEAMHTAFRHIGPRFRSVTLTNIDEYVNIPSLKGGVVYSVCAPSSKAEYDQALTLYAARGMMPEWEFCMVCSKYTSLESITNFILRWKKSHLFGRENTLFYLLEINHLPYGIQDETGRMLRELAMENASTVIQGRTLTRGPLILSCKGGKHMCPLAAQFQHSLISNSALPEKLLRLIFARPESATQALSHTCVEVHHGRYAGSGKSFNIRLKAATEEYSYTFVPVNGPANMPQERSVLLKRILRAMDDSNGTGSLHIQKKPLLHVDIANSINPSLSSVLFELCTLGVVADGFGECVVCLPPGSAVCLELAASLLHSTLPHCLSYPIKIARASRSNFYFCEKSLQQGMGADFTSPLFDGTVGMGRGSKNKRDHASNSFTRLQYVCVALNVLHYAKGTFPYEFEVVSESSIPDTQLNRLLEMKKDIDGKEIARKEQLAGARTLEDKEKIGEGQERIASAHSIEKLLFTGRGIDGSRAFDLLFSAIKQGKTREAVISPTQANTHISLWCMWNFVNVMFWQLKEMHVLDSPLNGACMPDAHTGVRTLEEDTRSKRKIKGEIMQFIIRTAEEFATRQSEVKHTADRITGLRVTGMGRSVFNKHWIRMVYDNDGKPCFRSPCSTYFIYYRALANCWVIDDMIETSGATYAFSSNGDINSLWTASPEWAKTNAVTSSHGPHDSAAYRSETVSIVGCARLGGNCSHTEDGLYLRQPPYDDINGNPHYIKTGSGARRHFFYSKFRRWIIAPQCNEDEGYFIMSEGGQFSNNWLYLPADAPERRAAFQYVRRGAENEAYEESKGLTSEATMGAPNGGFDHDDDDIDVEEQASEYELELLRWQDSNHECILFNNEAHTVAFLCANPSLMTKSLHPMLLRHLEQNGIHIEGGTGGGEQFSSSYWKTLSALTGIAKGENEASQLLGGSYCLTGDSLLKILAIMYRVRCGIPVVLLGECGCGKTALLSFLCAWLQVELIALDVHGGTTEADILEVFDRAGDILLNNPKTSSVYVFLDEINTCAHMGLITEAICRRSINGRRIHEGIQVLAALNPYRTRPPRPDEAENAAVGLQHSGAVSNEPVSYEEVAANNMKNLVYKVHPIPPTLKDFIFDFGALDLDTEALYIQSMVTKQLAKCSNGDERSIISDLISRSQDYVRHFEGDPSVVSLRDVQRCIDLIKWFFLEVGVGKKGSGKAVQVISALGRSTMLAIAMVYGYRLPSAQARNSYFMQMASIVKRWSKTSTKVNFEALGRAGFAQTVLDNMMRRFVNNLVVEESIALNQALTENLFVSIICILNKIPIFIVGKPGTSKTLAIQIIASNLQGSQSPMPLWRKFPAVYIFQYQCSPLSTSSSILYQFEAAKSYQEHSEDVLTVLLLDEVGLAENSPDMPLKVLHYMLVNPPVAIVGLSNWALDSSKMNRAVCLQRPEPSPEDIMFTGQNIVGASKEAAVSEGDSDLPTKPVLAREKSGTTRLQPWLMNLAHAFHKIYSDQKEFFGAHSRDFIGMRDYYSLLKHLRQEYASRGSVAMTPEVLVNAVARNFGGKPHAIHNIVNLFYSSCFPGHPPASCPEPPAPLALIRENMQSTTSRHLMVLSTHDTALHLLFGSKVLNQTETTVLVGSRFKDDLQELHIVQQINQVKNAMARGQTVALMHNESMFESLYDVLNQRYVQKTDIETGQEKRMLRLALGPRSQLCAVEEGFKLIVIVDQQQAYDSLDLPLLNRFEKQVLFPRDLLKTDCCTAVLEKLGGICNTVLTESGFTGLSEVFCGYYAETLPSLVLNMSDFGRKEICTTPSDLEVTNNGILFDDLVSQCTHCLFRVAFPTALMKSNTLRSFGIQPNEHASANKRFSLSQMHIFSLLDEELYCQDLPANKLLVVTTKSPVAHFQLAMDSWTSACESSSISDKFKIRSAHLRVVQLALISSERQLKSDLSDFLRNFKPSAPSTLVVICDPLHCSPSLISHARFVCAGAMQTHADNDRAGHNKRNIVFVMHLPPGVRSRRREYILDFHPPWQYAFIDDVRADGDMVGFSVDELVQKSSYEIYSNARQVFRRTLVDNFQSALSRCVTPARVVTTGTKTSQWSYFKVTLDLLSEETFLDHVEECSLLCLRQIGDSNSDDVPLQVTVACADYENIAGTFQESLVLALENLAIQALAHAIRNIDHDFNMGCIHSILRETSDSEDRVRYLHSWLAMAKKLCSPESIARTALIVAPTSVDYNTNCVVRNSGLHGPLSCRFPFSEKIVAIIGHDHTRHQVEAVVASNAVEIGAQDRKASIASSIKSTASFVNSVLGGEGPGTLLGTFVEADAYGYLHDFVASVIHPLPGVTEDTYYRLFMLMIEASADTTNGYLPSVVHSCFWSHETDLFHVSSVISGIHDYVEANPDFSLFEEAPLSNWLLERLERGVSQSHSLDSLICVNLAEYFLDHVQMCVMKDIKFLTSQAGYEASLETRAYDMRTATGLVRIIRKTLPHLRVLVTSCAQRLAVCCSGADKVQLTEDQLAVLTPFWRLCSASIFMAEMISIAQTSKRLDKVDTRMWHSMAVVMDQTFSYSPFSCDSLRDILALSNSGLPSCGLLRSYLLDFVRNEYDFVNEVVGCKTPMTPQLISLAGSMLLPSLDYNYSADKKGFLTLRREVVSLLVHVMNSSFIESATEARRVLVSAMTSGDDAGTEVIILYMGHLEDAYAAGALHCPLDTSLLCSFMFQTDAASAEEMFQTHAPTIFIQAVQTRSQIRQLAAAVGDYMSRTTYNQCDFPVCENDAITALLLENDWAKIFFIKCLRDIGGNELLVEYLKRRRNHPALPSDSSLIDDAKRKSLGASVVEPFAMLHSKEAFVRACDAYQASALRTGSRHPLDAFMRAAQSDFSLSRRSGLSLLIAALFTGHCRGDNTTTIKNWLNEEFTHMNAPGCVHGAYDTNGVGKRVLNWILDLDEKDSKSKIELGMDQLVVHAALLAIENPNSWLEMVVMNPARLTKVYVPSMPSSVLESLVKAMGYVGWYKCKNGHPYTVGNCTYPMEEATCSAPGCNAKIGGTNHNAVKGAVRLGAGTAGYVAEPGYFANEVLEKDSYNNDLTCMVVRLMLHCLMLLSASDHRTQQSIHNILKGKKNFSSAQESLKERMALDFNSLKQTTMLPEDDLFMALHMTFQKWNAEVRGNSLHSTLETPESRSHFMTEIENCAVNQVFNSRDRRENIRRMKELSSGTSITLLLGQCFGKHWGRVLEREDKGTDDGHSTACMIGLWAIREPVTFDTFSRWFHLQSSNARNFPVISAVLQHEKTLPCIKYIADILAWQSFLFSVLPSTTTREQASAWTNIEVVRDVAPPDRLEEGQRLLANYCSAFNASFPLVAFLYECNPNPFLTDDGQVDLSGGKRGGDDVCMGPHTTVNFSLPTAFHGETEAAGLCSIRLLTTLQDLHNRIVSSLKDISTMETQTVASELEVVQEGEEEQKGETRRNHIANAHGYLRPGVAPALQAARGEVVADNADADAEEHEAEEEKAVRVPVTSHRTPTSIVLQRLLVYERMTTLMPIVTSAVYQYPEPSMGNIQGFDMSRINAELRETLLAQCSPLALHVLQFQFAGEIRKSGGLRGLAAKTKQEPLPSAVISQIWEEIDTQMRLVRLLAVLEECISFIVLAGGAGSGSLDENSQHNTLLERYVLDTLLMNPKKWDEMRCPSLAQHVKLCHLQALYLSLEERSGEDPLGSVALAYREQLPSHLEAALRHSASVIDSFLFLPILREFCSEQLAAATWPEEANLKEYMGYSSEVDLDKLAWFAAVPDELELRHAYWTYKLLSS